MIGIHDDGGHENGERVAAIFSLEEARRETVAVVVFQFNEAIEPRAISADFKIPAAWAIDAPA